MSGIDNYQHAKDTPESQQGASPAWLQDTESDHLHRTETTGAGNQTTTRQLEEKGLLPQVLMDFATSHHGDLDLDSNGYVSEQELTKIGNTQFLSRNLHVVEKDLVSVMKRNWSTIADISNDEWGKENDGITLKDAAGIAKLPSLSIRDAESAAVSARTEGKDAGVVDVLRNNFDGLDMDSDGFVSVKEMTRVETSKLWSRELTVQEKSALEVAKKDFRQIAEGSNDEVGFENNGITRDDLKNYSEASAFNLANLPKEPGDHLYKMKVGNDERDVLLHIPKNYDGSKKMPLMIFLHSFRGDAESMASLSRMNDKADKDGFIVAYPQGNEWSFGGIRSWNVGVVPSPSVDDSGFVNALIDTSTEGLAIDKNRVYVAGYSNGGMLAQEVGTKFSDKIAAIATVSSSMTGLEQKPTDKVSVLMINGTGDNVVPIEGGYGWLNEVGLPTFVPRENTKAFWRTALNANNVERSTLSDKVSRETWRTDDGRNEFTMYTLDGANHTYPGGDYISTLGPVTKTANATDIIWDFFKTQSKAIPDATPKKDEDKKNEPVKQEVDPSMLVS